MYLVGEESPPIQATSDLVEYFRQACKPRDEWRIGTENEMLGVLVGPGMEGKSVPYDGPHGLKNILLALEKNGWEAVREGENIIALTCKRDTQVSIEPGGQFEYAARPHRDSHDLKTDLDSFLEFIRVPSEEIGAAWISVGFRPWGNLDEIGWVPKHRYQIMREYLPTRGPLSHEMMKRTATVQVNLDYGSEQDAADKLRSMMSVTSLLTAIYANSPITDGKPNGYQSFRAHIWTVMDPDRCGLLDLAFEDGDVFEKYTQWALDVPLFFVHRESYIAAGGMTFRQFMDKGFEGHKPTMDDWGLHLSTLFPDARLKKYMEIRGCDANTRGMTLALGALAAGLFYDSQSCAAATALTASLTLAQRREFADAVNRQGFDARLPGSKLSTGELCRELVELAVAGLKRVDPTELPVLEPILEVVESKRSYATRLLELWDKHNGDPTVIAPILSYHSKA